MENKLSHTQKARQGYLQENKALCKNKNVIIVDYLGFAMAVIYRNVPMQIPLLTSLTMVIPTGRLARKEVGED